MADKKIFANYGPTKHDVPHSGFDLSHAYNGTFRAGRIYPILTYLAPPNSSFRIKPYLGLDMWPMAFPIQTNVRAHVSFYKIPLRILWKHYKEFIGQHAVDGTIATPQTELRVPYISRTEDWHKTGSLADYFGIPSEVITSELQYVNTNRTPIFDVPAEAAPTYIDMRVNSVGVHQNSYDIQTSFPSYGTGGYSATLIPWIKDYVSSSSDEVYVKILAPADFANFPSTIKVMPMACSRNNTSLSHYTPSMVALESCGVSRVTSGDVAVTADVVAFQLKITLTSEVKAKLAQLCANGATAGLYMVWPSTAAFGTAVGDPCNNVTAANLSTMFTVDKELSTIVNVNSIGLLINFSYQSLKTFSGSSQYAFRAGDENNDGKPHFPISALPFRALEFVYNYFFRNERVIPFTKDGHPVFNEFITNDGDGADSTTPVDFFHAPYEYDLFTTCVKTPQFGNAPLVGITTNDNQAIFAMRDVSVTDDGQSDGNYSIVVDTHDDKIVGISNYDEVADKASAMRLREAIQYGISINDFRNVNALQRFQERYLKAGTKYQNIVKEFFNVSPPIGEEFPEYIGGFTQSLSMSKVMSTAQKDESGANGLGSFVGQGSFKGKGKTIRCFTSEDSYILGIMYITCTPTYSQKLDRHWTKSTLLDFFNPQFANLGLQPVYNHQIAPLQIDLTQPDAEGGVFGYNRPYADYVSMQDEVHGDFRTTLANYLVQRIFGSVPQLGKDFLEVSPTDMNDVFLNTDDDDKFYGQLYFDMRAKLPIPRFAVPRII